MQDRNVQSATANCIVLPDYVVMSVFYVLQIVDQCQNQHQTCLYPDSMDPVLTVPDSELSLTDKISDIIEQSQVR